LRGHGGLRGKKSSPILTNVVEGKGVFLKSSKEQGRALGRYIQPFWQGVNDVNKWVGGFPRRSYKEGGKKHFNCCLFSSGLKKKSGRYKKILYGKVLGPCPRISGKKSSQNVVREGSSNSQVPRRKGLHHRGGPRSEDLH